MNPSFLLARSITHLLPSIAVIAMLNATVLAQRNAVPSIKPVSYVDYNLDTAQKYTFRVDGKPFFMINIQVRMEKLRYRWGWDAAAREAIIAQAAADEFNTVSIPIHWYEVEQRRDAFDWAVLDEYLGLVNKHHLKMEMLWFGQNSGGQTQWLDDQHLRVPAYVLSSPNPKSKATTSSYRIRRDLSDYTLDMGDTTLAAREAYVLSKVMNHIATWDKANGSAHPVIGVQLGNEVTGYDFNRQTFTSAQVIAYMNRLGRAVKQSPYVVWTRLNCVWGMEDERIEVNESLRSLDKTNIDFVGVDLYKVDYATVKQVLPYKGQNYRMIMEFEAELPTAAQSHLAAIAGNNALDLYDMCGPDGHGLYDRKGETGFAPHGIYVEAVRTLNKLLNSDRVDLALNANGYGLFVHNWNAHSMQPTVGVEGITFTPIDTLSQAISIHRSNTELVLMNTQGGTFHFPDSLQVTDASKGYFDADNKWVSEGAIPFTATSVAPPPGVTVRLVRKDTREIAGRRMQAEFASFGLGSFIQSNYIGFAGNGYINLNAPGGVVHWTKVDGGSGGNHILRFRCANGGTAAHPVRLLVNGVAQTIFFPPTGSWETYRLVSTTVPLKSDAINSIRLEATEEGAGFVDELEVL